MKRNRFLVLGMLAMTLGACTAKPVLLNASEQGVVVRYDPNRVTASDAAAAAQGLCAKYGRNAVQGDTALTGEVFVTFSCEK